MSGRDDKRGKRRGFASSVLWGAIAGFAVVFVFFMAASSLVLAEKMPESAMKALTMITALVGVSVGSVVAAKRRGPKILATGLTTGGVMFFVMLAGAVLSDAGGTFQGTPPLLFLMSIAGAALGTALCFRRKKHKRA